MNENKNEPLKLQSKLLERDLINEISEVVRNISHAVNCITERAIKSATNHNQINKNQLGIDELSKLIGIETKEISGWVNSKHIPHYWIMDQGPFFKKSEVLKWMKDNIILEVPGKPLPTTLSVITTENINNKLLPPSGLSLIDGIQKISLNGSLGSGIYFLCRAGNVVYVGKSICVASRIATHWTEKQKDFDSVWYLPVPERSLDELERGFIKSMKPEYNVVHNNGEGQ